LFCKRIERNIKQDLKIKELEGLYGYIPPSVTFNYLSSLKKLHLKRLGTQNRFVEISVFSKLKSLDTLIFSHYDLNHVFYDIFKLNVRVIGFFECIISENKMKKVKFPVQLSIRYLVFDGIRNIPEEFLLNLSTVNNFDKITITFKNCNLSPKIIYLMKTDEKWKHRAVVIERNFAVIQNL
jgi:hypothetical protein